ncbi:MAG: class I SAM-dependent methyltransferase [Dolichospermum sp.]
MQCLNLGCGDRYHPDWTNINFISTDEGVIAHNLKQGIPFPDESFDVVYHSHVLEHFPKTEGERFIQECYRVLRPQGVLRVVVPDLEQITRMYLHSLEKASHGFEEWKQNYQWMLLEMYDQTVRNCSGGEMKSFLSRKELCNQEFVIKRCGVEIQNIIVAAQKEIISTKPEAENFVKKLLKHIYRLLRYSDYRHQAILKVILSSSELESLKIGQFRQSGEIHQWMYDSFSLGQLLEKCGFYNIVKRDAFTSTIADWEKHCWLDVEDGEVRKPDSLFMEAIK